MSGSAASIPGTPADGEFARVVVLKGEQSTPLPVVPGIGGGTAATVTRVATNIAAVTLLAANTNRFSAAFYNNSTQRLALKLGTAPDIGAGTESFTTIIEPGAPPFFLQNGDYNGEVTGIWFGADASGECLITEVV